AHEEWREHAHEPGKRDEFDLVRTQRGVDLAFKRFAILLIRTMINRESFDARRSRAFQSLRFGVVGDDELNLVVVLLRIEQGLQMRAAPGNEDGGLYRSGAQFPLPLRGGGKGVG